MGADLSISTKLHGMGTGGSKHAPTGAADRPRSFRVLCLLSLFCRSPDGRKWAAGVRTQSASTPQVWCRVRRSNLA